MESQSHSTLLPLTCCHISALPAAGGENKIGSQWFSLGRAQGLTWQMSSKHSASDPALAATTCAPSLQPTEQLRSAQVYLPEEAGSSKIQTGLPVMLGSSPVRGRGGWGLAPLQPVEAGGGSKVESPTDVLISWCRLARQSGSSQRLHDWQDQGTEQGAQSR